MSQVLIVGGGPAGSFLALHLVRKGVSVTVLEARRFPRDKACGEFISPLGVRCLKDAGLLDAVLNAGAQWVDRARLCLPSGIAHEAAFNRGVEGIRALTLPRRDLDALLLNEAEKAGAEVRQEFRVSKIERLRDVGWRISCPAGETVEGVALAGADGVGSVVARRMGWLRQSWPQRMGITATFAGFPVSPGAIEMHLHPGQYCGVVGQSDGTAHLGLAFDYHKGDWPEHHSPAEVMDARLNVFPGLAQRLTASGRKESVKAFGPIGVRSTRIYGDGVLLVGDAAGFLDPVTGHGIGFALRSAQLAAATLSAALRQNDLTAPSLSAYADGYRKELGRPLNTFRWFQRALALPLPALQCLRYGLETCPPAAAWLIRRSVKV